MAGAMDTVTADPRPVVGAGPRRHRHNTRCTGAREGPTILAAVVCQPGGRWNSIVFQGAEGSLGCVGSAIVDREALVGVVALKSWTLQRPKHEPMLESMETWLLRHHRGSRCIRFLYHCVLACYHMTEAVQLDECWQTKCHSALSAQLKAMLRDCEFIAKPGTRRVHGFAALQATHC